MSTTPPTRVEQRCLGVERGLPPPARVSRAAAMLVWARRLIARQIQAERAATALERRTWEVAMRTYGGAASASTLVQWTSDRVSA